MDAHTLEVLEFDKVAAEIVRLAQTGIGKERARRLAPLTTAWEAAEELALTSQMKLAIAESGNPPLGGVTDIRLAVRKSAAPGAVLGPQDFTAVRSTLVAAAAVRDYLRGLGEGLERLKALVPGLGDHSETVAKIDRVVGENSTVLDSASPELAKIRREIRGLESQIQKRLRALVERPDVRRNLQYPQPTISEGRYVLAVITGAKASVPGIVHRSSDSGATLYIEPAAIVELGNDLAEARETERDEVARVLAALTAELGAVSESILATVDVLADADVLAARARYSRLYKMTEPELAEDGVLELRSARHPVLLGMARLCEEAEGHAPVLEVVPIDVRLGDDFDTLVVTGPNTGGKTVALKTVGLAALMAASGLHVPAAEGSRVPFYGEVFADIGDEQSIEQSLSTFSSHISRIIDILGRAAVSSLVLLDELGAGTDPAEGAALGRAVLDALRARGSKNMVSTHLGSLKLYALATERAENAAVEFDPETLAPTFRLVTGEAGSSNALYIARRLGMPGDVVRAAEEYLGPRDSDFDKAMDEAGRARRYAESVRREAEDLRTRAAEAEREADEARRLAEGRLAEIESRTAPLAPGDEVRVPRYEQRGLLVSVNSRRGTGVVNVGAVEMEFPLEEMSRYRAKKKG